MGRFVLIAVLAGCYDPSVADCVDTCTADQLCPDGLTCDAHGFCRVAGATAMCATGSGSGSGSGSCPIAPMGRGTPNCATAMPINAAFPDCIVDCMPASAGSAASGYTVGTWREAQITSSTAETTAKSLAGNTPAWIGLHAPAGMGATPSAWTWTDGTAPTYVDWASGQPVDNAAGNCAAVGPGGWASEPCTASHPFLINTAPMP